MFKKSILWLHLRYNFSLGWHHQVLIFLISQYPGALRIKVFIDFYCCLYIRFTFYRIILLNRLPGFISKYSIPNRWDIFVGWILQYKYEIVFSTVFHLLSSHCRNLTKSTIPPGIASWGGTLAATWLTRRSISSTSTWVRWPFCCSSLAERGAAPFHSTEH